MKRFVVSTLLLAVTPMILLNPLGREAFSGYYIGVVAMWFVFVCAQKESSTSHALLASAMF